MAQFIYRIFDTSSTNDRRTEWDAPDKAKKRKVAFDVYDNEDKTLKRYVVNSTDERFEELSALPTCQQGVEQGLLTKEEVDKIGVTAWKAKRYNDMDDWIDDIRYYIENVSYREFLMLPCTVTFRKKQYEGTLAKIDSVYYGNRRAACDSKIKAMVLLPTGEVINALRENISISPEVLARLAIKYAQLLDESVIENENLYPKLFPYNDEDCEAENKKIEAYLSKKMIDNIKHADKLMNLVRRSIGESFRTLDKNTIGSILRKYFDRA